MIEANLDRFFEQLDYYPVLLLGLALAALIGYSVISGDQRKNESVRLSLWIVVLVGFYEVLAGFLASQKIENHWVYNFFNSHVAAILFLLLLRSFLKKEGHRKLVYIFIVLFLLISFVLHLAGFVHYNDTGEYLTFFNTILILCSCGLYFFELLTLEEFLGIDPLKEFSFWSSTAILFYFSSTFMIFISYKYLYTNHLDIYYMVIEIPRTMALLCNLLLCSSIYSLVIKNRFKLEFLHV
jgi:hypothetical protein